MTPEQRSKILDLMFRAAVNADIIDDDPVERHSMGIDIDDEVLAFQLEFACLVAAMPFNKLSEIGFT